VPYGWHYKSFVQGAKHWMDRGVVGEIQYVLCHMASPLRTLFQGLGFDVKSNSGQAGDILFQPDPKTWADPTVSGGGYGQAQLSHSTGMLFWLTGLVPEAAFALMANSNAKVDMYDAISVRFTNGAIGTISGAGTIPPAGNARYQVDIRIFGTEGLLMLDLERARLDLRKHDGTAQQLDLAPDAGTYSCDGPPHNFVDLVVGKSKINWSPGEAAMRSVVLLDAAYRSAASGKMEQC
jgi:predicted dehydrogenase